MAGRKIPISNRISNGGFSIAMSVLRGGKIYGLSVFSIMQFVFLNLTSPTQKKTQILTVSRLKNKNVLNQDGHEN